MNPKIPMKEKAKNAGISLKPDLTQQVKELARSKGLSLSAYVSMLFSEALEKAGQANLKKAHAAAQRGKAKITQALKKKK